MSRIVLTGAAGMVGGGILRRLLESGRRVTMATSTPGLRSLHPRLDIAPFDLAAPQPDPALSAALRECDGVVHAAAVVPPREALASPDAMAAAWRANVGGTATLMAAAAAANAPCFVFISALNLFPPTVGVIDEETRPDPPNLYTLSKLVGEQAAAQFARISATRFAGLRISAPYGPGRRARAVVPTFVEAALAGQDLTLDGDGSRRQLFTFTDDVARACEACLDRRAEGVFNIAGAASVSMLELAQATLRAAPDRGARIVFSGRPDPGAGGDRRADLSRAATVLGWAPEYSLDDGLRAMIAAVENPPFPLFAASNA
jgi:UDP-glucose 4-epimerase